MAPLTITPSDLLEDFLFPVPVTKLYSVRSQSFSPNGLHSYRVS